MPGVFGHDAGGIARHRWFPLAEPGLDFSLGEFNVQRAGRHIEDDDVAGFERRDGAFLRRFRSDMAGPPVGATGTERGRTTCCPGVSLACRASSPIVRPVTAS